MSGTQHLPEAVAAFRAVLQEYTQARVPPQWAATQNNLGTALRDLGERDKDSVQLCDELQAHTSASQVFQAAPPYYASRRCAADFARAP